MVNIFRNKILIHRLVVLESDQQTKTTSQDRKRMKHYKLEIKSWEGVVIKRLVHPETKKPYFKLKPSSF